MTNGRDNFDFDIVNFPFWMVMFLVLYSVYISQLIRFARASTQAYDFNNLNEIFNS